MGLAKSKSGDLVIHLANSMDKGRASHSSGLALEFAQDRVSLWLTTEANTWRCAGVARVGEPDFDDQIARLRLEACTQPSQRATVDIWLPPEQILEREYFLDNAETADGLHEAIRRIEAESVYRASELSLSLSRPGPGEPVIVLAALRQTVREAREYAESWGFVPARISARGYDAEFPNGAPEFDSKRATEAAATKYSRARIAASIGILALGITAGWHLFKPSADVPEVGAITTTHALAVTLKTLTDHDEILQPISGGTSRPAYGPAKDLSWPRLILDSGPTVPKEAPTVRRGVSVATLEASTISFDDIVKLGHAPAEVERYRPSRLVGVSGKIEDEKPLQSDIPTVSSVEPGSVETSKATLRESPVPTPKPIHMVSTAESAPASKGVQLMNSGAGDPIAIEAPALLAAPKPKPRPLAIAPPLPAKIDPPSIRISNRAPRRVRSAAAEHGLALHETNLIGIIDANTGRQALLRLSGGDYLKVRRGDQVEGWRVSTISAESVRLTRNGKRRILLLVSQ